MHTSRQQQNNSRVLQHLPLVHPIAKHYALRTGQDRDDLIQVGRLGLIKAANRFSPKGDNTFAAFAKPHIRGAILHYLRDRVALVRLPRRVEERGLQLSRCNEDKSAEDAQLQRMYASKSTWVALDENLLQAEATALETIDQQDRARAVRAALCALPEVQKRAIQQVVIEGESLRKAARTQGVSAMTIQRRVKQGLMQLNLDLRVQATQT